MKPAQALSRSGNEVHPVLVSAASIAHGWMRSLAIKPYKPRVRKREFAVAEQLQSLHEVRCQLFRERGAGQIPTIVIAGFVPDSTETIEFQRPLLRKYGSIYYVNYPRNGFSRELFAAQLTDMIADVTHREGKPLLLGVSFGAGILVDFLRNGSELIHECIRGVVLVSPVICTADLIRPADKRKDGIRFLESSLEKIVKANPDNRADLEKQVERSRRCFQALFAAGAGNRTLGGKHLAIRKKIMDVLALTSARGGYERVKALRELDFPDGSGSVFSGPTLVLLAESEGDILVPSSPTLAVFGDPARYEKLFPRCLVRKVISKNSGDSVPHASLIFHHEAYNPLLACWYDKQVSPLLSLAV